MKHAIAVVLVSVVTMGVARADDETRKRLDEVEDRLDVVEKKTILDRIRWGADYRTVLNTFVYRGPTSDPYALSNPQDPLSRRRIHSTTEEVWSHRLRLKAKAEPISSIRLTARMVMFKHFGDGDAPPFIQDSMSTSVPRDAGIRFDQLWLDWFLFGGLALSAGRIAYTEGNPNELRENSTTRRATWGLHMVDGEYETVNLTLDLGWLMPGTYVRGFYASWFNDNDDDPMGGFPFLTSGTDNLRIVGGNVDLMIPRLGKNFVQIGYFMVPRFRPFNIPIPDPGFDPAQDYTHAPAFLNGSLLFPSEMPDSLGSYQNVSMLIELYDVFGSGIDWFAAGALGIITPNGKGIEYELPVSPTQRMSTPFLFLASQGDDGLTGFVYAGLRYTLPVKLRPKIGFEFNWGSRYMISFATQTDQLLTKLAVRGRAYESYLILPINKHVFLRASYLYIDNDYQTGFFGPNPALTGSTAPPFEQQIHNIQVVLDVSI